MWLALAASPWDGEPAELSSTALLDLGPVHVGGFVQAQYEYHRDPREDVREGVSIQDGHFLVPRARLQLRYSPAPVLRLVGEVEATGDGVEPRDVALTFVEPWSRTGQELTAGHFKIPFGIENPRILDPELEFMTLSRVTRELFEPRRNYGLMLSGRLGPVEHALAVLGGDDDAPRAADRVSSPDVVARVGAGARNWGVGASGLVGRRFFDGRPSARAWRAGADAHVVVRVPIVGPLTARGEYIESGDATRGRGYYVALVQRIWRRAGVGARLDGFDRDLDRPNTASRTISGVVFVDVLPRLRVLVEYDHVQDRAGLSAPEPGVVAPADRSNDVVALRVQGLLY